jgi:hypothetical protein
MGLLCLVSICFYHVQSYYQELKFFPDTSACLFYNMINRFLSFCSFLSLYSFYSLIEISFIRISFFLSYSFIVAFLLCLVYIHTSHILCIFYSILGLSSSFKITIIKHLDEEYFKLHIKHQTWAHFLHNF